MSSCSAFAYDVLGRAGIAVSQGGGNDYPLLAPSADIQDLIADLYLGYDDLSDYGPDPEFLPPFKIAWLYGVGCLDEVSPPDSASASFGGEAPVATHAADIIITDDNDTVVFDSTTTVETASTGFATRTWGPRLRIYEWYQAEAVCRLVAHTRWPDDDNEPEARNYPIEIFPEDGTIDARAIERWPKRVRALIVDGASLTAANLTLSAGYNFAIVSQPLAGLNQIGARILLSATPGEGLGTINDCGEASPLVSTVGGVGPNENGHFYLNATDCYAIRQATKLSTGSPRTAMPYVMLNPYKVPEEDLPTENAGISTSPVDGWPADKKSSHLFIGGDCGPCSDCDDFASLAQAMVAVADRYRKIGQQLEHTRDQYHDAIDRVSEAGECTAQILRASITAQRCPDMEAVAQFCNTTGDCITSLALTVQVFTSTFDSFPGEILPNTVLIYGLTKPAKLERYTPDGAWPTIIAHWDAVDPGATVYMRFRFRLLFDGMVGEAPQVVKLHLSGESDQGTYAEIIAAATANCPSLDPVA